MTTCERCEEMGCVDCENCYLGNPCLGCEHDGVDCTGQCYEKEVNENGTNIVHE